MCSSLCPQDEVFEVCKNETSFFTTPAPATTTAAPTSSAVNTTTPPPTRTPNATTTPDPIPPQHSQMRRVDPSGPPMEATYRECIEKRLKTEVPQKQLTKWMESMSNRVLVGQLAGAGVLVQLIAVTIEYLMQHKSGCKVWLSLWLPDFSTFIWEKVKKV